MRIDGDQKADVPDKVKEVAWQYDVVKLVAIETPPGQKDGTTIARNRSILPNVPDPESVALQMDRMSL